VRGISLNYVIAELWAAKQHTVTIGTRSHACIETENHATSFFIVNMASCMDGGCAPSDDLTQHGSHTPANIKPSSIGLQHTSLMLDTHVISNI